MPARTTTAAAKARVHVLKNKAKKIMREIHLAQKKILRDAAPKARVLVLKNKVATARKKQTVNITSGRKSRAKNTSRIAAPGWKKSGECIKKPKERAKMKKTTQSGSSKRGRNRPTGRTGTRPLNKLPSPEPGAPTYSCQQERCGCGGKLTCKGKTEATLHGFL